MDICSAVNLAMMATILTAMDAAGFVKWNTLAVPWVKLVAPRLAVFTKLLQHNLQQIWDKSRYIQEAKASLA
jgi:hypothetical protein